MPKKPSVEKQLRQDLQEANNLLKEQKQWYENMLTERNQARSQRDRALEELRQQEVHLNDAHAEAREWRKRFDLLLSNCVEIKK